MYTLWVIYAIFLFTISTLRLTWPWFQHCFCLVNSMQGTFIVLDQIIICSTQNSIKSLKVVNPIVED